MRRIFALGAGIAATIACAPPCFAALPWSEVKPLAPNEVLVPTPSGIERETIEAARAKGLLIVDLSDGWTPFIFSETDGAGKPVKPNAYRTTFVALANDQTTPDEIFSRSPAGRQAILSTVPRSERSTTPGVISAAEQQALDRALNGLGGERSPNFLEVYGIPPTLSVLERRIELEAVKNCAVAVDRDAIRELDSEIGYQSWEQVRKEAAEATDDAAWVAGMLTTLGIAAGTLSPGEESAKLAAADPQIDPARLERYQRGQKRLRAVKAVQQRLVCEGMLAAGRFTPGALDLATNQALAAFERKNDIFGWGFVSGETRAALVRPSTDLDFDTLRRVLAERVAEAAGIVEDGSVSKGSEPATFVDETGAVQPVRNLIAQFVDALLGTMGIATADDMIGFLRAIATGGLTDFRVAFRPPPLPPYYASIMDLSAEIDRGDVWYDLPLDARGQPINQPRKRFPHFTLFVNWREQKIPLVSWRTTIGSWRSQLGNDGYVYLKYKNSDVGPRIWKNIVAAPVWVPPPSTPGKDLLTRKVLPPRHGPMTVVNTDVMGPGFASAYGLVMAIHLKKLEGGGVFDNQIRTHGSVDYTSIARRFSHGCHRLVNNRAVRLFDFVLRHRNYARLGDHEVQGSGSKRRFSYQGRRYTFNLTTRGYYYNLRPPLPIMVHEGTIRGAVRSPIERYVRKPGVDYGPLPADNPVENQPVAGP